MISEYLVIKLPGNWIEREQTRARIKAFLKLDVLDEKAVHTYSYEKRIPQEVLDQYSAVNIVAAEKDRMAVFIGKSLVESGLLQFKEYEDGSGKMLEGCVTVIVDRMKGGE